jgi:hypothetical protein
MKLSVHVITNLIGLDCIQGMDNKIIFLNVTLEFIRNVNSRVHVCGFASRLLSRLLISHGLPVVALAVISSTVLYYFRLYI